MKSTEASSIPKPFVRIKHVGEQGWAKADNRLAGINTPTQLKKQQVKLKTVFERVFGEMPDPRAEIEHTWGREWLFGDVKVRQVVLRSDLGYGISGLTCVRKGLRGPLPGLVWASGHCEDASWHDEYLKFSLYAAMCGFYVMAFDPPGQGRRREVFHEDDDPVYWSPCKQHQSMNAPIMLIEEQLGKFAVRDCVTAVSFLCQQSRVDSARIGFSGQSGGGLQTYMAMGADSRISVAVPQQATSSRRGAFQQMVSRDAEQSFYRCWPEGLDCHEMGTIFAPRPLRIMAEYGYFDQGDIYRKLLPVYAAAGHEDRLEIASTGCRHGLTRTAREVCMQWMIRWLAPPCPLPIEPDWKGFHRFHRELVRVQRKATLRDQGIIRYCAEKVMACSGRRSGKSRALKRLRYLRGINRGDCNLVGRGGRPVKNARSGKNLLRLNDSVEIPFDLTRGRGSRDVVAVVLDAEGRKSRWSSVAVRRLKQSTGLVLSLDVFNCGELKTDKPYRTEPYYIKNRKYYSPDMFHALDAFMAGASPIGLAMEEVGCVLQAAVPDRAQLVFQGRGWPALSLLFMAALMPDVRECRLEDIPESYEALFAKQRLALGYEYIIPEALKYTDIPLIVEELVNRGTACNLKMLDLAEL